MVLVTDAVFDGSVLHPKEPLALPPNSNVRITIETADCEPPTTSSFFDTALNLHLDGPPDWATSFHRYLYGEVGDDAR
jgi:hypothetical protein